MFRLYFRTFLLAGLLPLQALAESSSYCVAIRGNGEAMPAHWGAMSSIVQKKGLPTAMAGGSSASITIFLLESLSLNKLAKTKTHQSLLIKSFQGYFETLAQSPESLAVAALLADKEKFTDYLQKAAELEQLNFRSANDIDLIPLLKKHLSSLLTLGRSAEFKALLNPDFTTYLQKTLVLTKSLERGDDFSSINKVAFRKDQISRAIKQFGKFDATTDETLFLRPGLVNFRHLAKIIGVMGDFYAGTKLHDEKKHEAFESKVKRFLADCSPNSENLTWRELTSQKPFCRQILSQAIRVFRESVQEENGQQSRINQQVGTHIAAFPTTSILISQAVQDFKELRGRYEENQDLAFKINFRVSQRDLKFGYWGKKEHLKTIESFLRRSTLTRDDAKSQKFISLGESNWLTVLSTSPAEPGLSSFIELDPQRISAGGWSDLHPTLVLKAYGCKDIFYVTRKGGESLFAQGVMKRLTDLSGFSFDDWSGLSALEIREKNSFGNDLDVGFGSSPWSKLYNMANPESSIRRSMSASTTTVCTDWDQFDAKAELDALIEDSFRAPWLDSKSSVCR